MQLHELQQEFLAALQGRANTLASYVQASSLCTKAQRIDVYKTSVQWGHVAVLEQTYPVCLQLLGSTLFYQLAKRYVAHYPSHRPSFAGYGALFPKWLAKEIKDTIPYMADMAALEWAFQLAYGGQNYPPLSRASREALLAKAPASIVFYLQPHGSLLQSDYPIHDLWQAHQQGLYNAKQWQRKSVWLWVWQYKQQVAMVSLDEVQWTILSAMQSGKNLDEIYQILEQKKCADLLIQWLPYFFECGWLVEKNSIKDMSDDSSMD